MENIVLVLGRLLLAGVAALLPGTLIWGGILAIYAAYRRLVAQLKLEVE